jgi:hypothetical protein
MVSVCAVVSSVADTMVPLFHAMLDGGHIQLPPMAWRFLIWNQGSIRTSHSRMLTEDVSGQLIQLDI